MTVLDSIVRASLAGPHSAYAVRSGAAARYPREMAPFAALPADPRAGDWDDLAGLAGLAGLEGPGGEAAGRPTRGGVALVDPPDLPAGWRVLGRFEAVQMICPLPSENCVPQADTSGSTEVGSAGVRAADELVELGPHDLDDVLALVDSTQPGPFGPRTMELGRFLGVRVDGRLVAMAGERMHPPGWTEVSAVCTDAAYRGRGLAARLVAGVTAGIHARGDGAVLHVMAANPGAIRVYGAVGFTVRRPMPILAVAPEVTRG